MAGLEKISAENGQNLLVQGLGPMFHTGFTDLKVAADFRDTLSYDKVKLSKFIAGMHNNGLRVIGRGLWYISAAHTDEDIESALRIAAEVMKTID